MKNDLRDIADKRPPNLAVAKTTYATVAQVNFFTTVTVPTECEADIWECYLQK